MDTKYTQTQTNNSMTIQGFSHMVIESTILNVATAEIITLLV